MLKKIYNGDDLNNDPVIIIERADNLLKFTSFSILMANYWRMSNYITV